MNLRLMTMLVVAWTGLALVGVQPAAGQSPDARKIASLERELETLKTRIAQLERALAITQQELHDLRSRALQEQAQLHHLVAVFIIVLIVAERFLEWQR